MSKAPEIGPDIEPVIRAWIIQLLSPELRSLLAARDGQVEIHLFANRGKVRKNPIIMFNMGPSEMVDA